MWIMKCGAELGGSVWCEVASSEKCRMHVIAVVVLVWSCGGVASPSCVSSCSAAAPVFKFVMSSSRVS